MKIETLALTILLAGCSSTNISEMVKALAKDPASACVSQHAVWGVGNVQMTACRTASCAKMTADPSGVIQIDSSACNAPMPVVPLIVRPEIVNPVIVKPEVVRPRDNTPARQ